MSKEKYKFEKNDKWFLQKKLVELKNVANFFVKEGQIWWVNAGYNIGNEIHGKGTDFKRPFLVIKKAGNMFIGVLLSTKGKVNSEFYIKINDELMGESSYIVKSQIQSIDKKRFVEKIHFLEDEEFENIKKELKEYIFS